MPTNQSHIQHLNRPAVAIFRKPLATNEEMTRELEKLLGDVAPINSKTIKQISGRGVVKAVYISPALHKMQTLGYDENLLFNTYSCPIQGEDARILKNDFLNFDLISRPPKVVSYTKEAKEAIRKMYNIYSSVKDKADSISNLPIGSMGAFIFSLGTGGLFIGKTFKDLCTSFSKKTILDAEKGINFNAAQQTKATEGDTDEAQKLLRTWYVATFDADYEIPSASYTYLNFASLEKGISSKIDYLSLDDTIHTVGSTTKTSGQRILNLNSRVVYSTKEIYDEKIFKEEIGYNVNKDFKKVLDENKPVRFFKIIFQGLSNYREPKLLTKKEVEENREAYFNKYKGRENLNTKSTLMSFILKYNERFAVDNTVDSRDAFEHSNTPIIYTTLGKESKIVKIVDEKLGRYKVAVKSVFKEDFANFTDFAQLIKKGTSDMQVPEGQYTKNVKDIEYHFEDGEGYLYFNRSATISDLATAFYIMCSKLNDTVNNTETGSDFSTYANSYSEFPLRYVQQTTKTGFTGTFTSTKLDKNVKGVYDTTDESTIDDVSKNEFNTALHTKALYDSYGRARIGSKNVKTKTPLTGYLDGTKMTLLDFKIMYYLLIKYNVILPKYRKLSSEFITSSKYSTVKMFPSDFFEVTDVLYQESKKPVQYLSAKEMNMDLSYYTDGTSISKEELIKKDLDRLKGKVSVKKKLVEVFESIYYGDWAGFYYTNSTPKNESIARYTNTEVDKNLLTNVFSKMSAKGIVDSMKASVSDLLSSLTSIQTTGLSDLNNKDVASISISRQAMGKSHATLLVNSIEEKYTYQKGVYKGETLFEPMDEVLIYLPTYDEKLELSFKGVLSSVETVNNNGYHNIIIECDCPLKLIDIVRTNIKPSYSFTEADYALIQPFQVPDYMMKSVEQWAPFMLMQGLSYFTSMLGNGKEDELVYTLHSIDEKASKGSFVQGPKFSDVLLTYLWYRRSKHNLDQNQAQLAFKELVDKYSTTVMYKNGERIDMPNIEFGITPLETIFKDNAKKNKSEYCKADYFIYAHRWDSTSIEGFNRRVVAKLTGTMQPAFALGTSSIPLTFSNYKTNYNILLETAEKFNFFLYSDKHGVVNFVPPNISLMNLSEVNGETNFGRVVPLGLDKSIQKDKNETLFVVQPIDYSYGNIESSIASNQTSISFRESVDDSKLINWIQLSGGFAQSDSLNAADAGVATTVANYPLIVKYGIHSQTQQVITGVTNRDALVAYGTALMDRNNKNFRTAMLDSVGTGDVDINTTVFSPINNTVYLRSGLSLSYTAGQTFITQSTLNWGRKPLFQVKLDKDGHLDLEHFSKELNNLKNGSKITYSYFKQINSIIEELKTTSVNAKGVGSNRLSLLNNINVEVPTASILKPGYNSLLSSFIFNGYFWDGVPSISFEDLSTTYYSNRVSSGLQSPVFTVATFSNSNNATKDKIQNINDSINKLNNDATLRNDTEVRLGLYEQSTLPIVKYTYIQPDTYVLRGQQGF